MTSMSSWFGGSAFGPRFGTITPSKITRYAGTEGKFLESAKAPRCTVMCTFFPENGSQCRATDSACTAENRTLASCNDVSRTNVTPADDVASWGNGANVARSTGPPTKVAWVFVAANRPRATTPMTRATRMRRTNTSYHVPLTRIRSGYRLSRDMSIFPGLLDLASLLQCCDLS
jgi:hypothetical protein